ncbi:MAG: bifunctional diaminohydroxyphosphoribosylaminopyrimidine deaminase/5-amino-6-(5-phosphoribosylamino)uracil reductase RibD [Planctomycetota bacterium]
MGLDPADLMRNAIALARKGARRVEPNPQVGAVLVKNGEIIGRGFHPEYGGPHAEVFALREAGDEARGAEAFVTLEPCSTRGQTPACTDALIEAGIVKVHYAVEDPNPLHAGAARRVLQEAGIEVEVGLGAEAARDLLKGFERRLGQDRPYVVAKWASTLDGRIATVTGDSRWISCDDSRRQVHAERARCRGILVGVETVIADDPELTTRLVAGKSPKRYVLDSKLRTPLDAKMLGQGESPVTIFYDQAASDGPRAELEARSARVVPVASGEQGLDLLEVLAIIRKEDGVGRLLVEGGARVHGSFLAARLVDQVQIFLAPKILGAGDGRASVMGPTVTKMAQALLLSDPIYECVGRDLLVCGDLDAV